MKHYILSAIVSLSIFGSNAQEKSAINAPMEMGKHVKAPMFEQNKFLSFSVGGGLSTLMHDIPFGSSEFGFGGGLNVDYNIFFNRVVGISFGLGGSMINSAVSFDLGSEYTTNIRQEGKNIFNQAEVYDAVCTTTFNDGWKEKQSIFSLDIPVGLLFRVPMRNKTTLLAGVGAKVSFPVKSTYEVTDGSEIYSLYVKDLDLTFDSVPNHGITTLSPRPSGNSETKSVCVNGYLDLNFVHRIGNAHFFYGLYGAYGFNSIAKSEKVLTSIIEHNDVVSSDAAGKIVPFSAGVRVGVKIPCPRLNDQNQDEEIHVKDKSQNTSVVVPVDTFTLDKDGDGVPDHLDHCPDTPKDIPVDVNGCPLDSDGDGVPDYLDNCPTVPGSKNNLGCPEVSEKARQILNAAGYGIEFEPGTAILIRSSCSYIDNIIQIMRENSKYRLIINSHTDDDKNMGVNMKISKRRAMVIADYMIERGIYPSRLKSFGYGATKPIVDNKNRNGKNLNNRIEFEVEVDQ